MSLHEPLPVLVLHPDGAHGLERDALGLRQEERNEDGHDGDPGGVVGEGGVLETAEHGEERLQLHEGEGQDDGHVHGLPQRPDVHGEYLARRHPHQRHPRRPEPGAVQARQHHHRHRVRPRHRRLPSLAELRAHDPSDGSLQGSRAVSGRELVRFD